MPKKSAMKKSAPRRRAVAKRPARKYKKSGNVGEYASLSVKRSIADGVNQFAANTLYSSMNTQLTDFPRAVQVARAYQHYRIKKIAITFKPSFDTFVIGGAVTKPRLYYMIDKSGSIPTNVSLEGLKAMGARPKDLDEKNIVISWSPSVLESVMYAGGVNNSTPSKYKVSPWMSTSSVPVQPGVFVPSGIDHLGLYWYVDMLNAGGYQYSCEVEVQFEFKKPLTDLLAGSPARAVNVASINDSADGIVGGGDGI